jgi:hypothetical protein
MPIVVESVPAKIFTRWVKKIIDSLSGWR